MRQPTLLETQAHEAPQSRMLHLLWELPPNITGGLGIASYHLAENLSKISHLKVDIASPQQLTNQQIADRPASKLAHYQLPLAGYSFPQSSFSEQNLAYNHPLDLLADLPAIEKNCASPESRSTKSATTIKTPAKAAPAKHTTAKKRSVEKIPSMPDNPVTAFNTAVKNCHFTAYQSIHAHDWMTASAAVTAQSSHFPDKPPIVLHIHSTQLERHGCQSKGALYKHELWAMQQAAAIIVVSQISKDIITRYYHISAEKIHVVHNSTPSDEPGQRQVQGKLNKELTILFAGRLVDQKSPELAVEIITRILRKYPTVKAIIAGSGEKLASIRALVKFKKIHERVEVIGSVPHDKMHIVYSTSDILIMPSAHEPFGLVALEAALAGVAVILSDRCGVAEILTAAPKLPIQNIDRWTNAISKLIDSESARNRLVKKLKRQAKAHTWKDAALEIDHIVESLKLTH